jgi:GT2 family glycosyltransferase
MPLISVLMSVYNAQRYLAQAVESILHQSLTDFEFLIVDDGSTDGSLAILQRYAQQDQRIRLLSRANRGLVSSLNQLLELAQGELIARMDADDIALPNRFAEQVAFLQQHPEVVCVGGAQDWIDQAGRVLLHHPEAQQNDEIQQLALSGRTPINHPSAMIRTAALRQVGGYDPSFYPAEDLDLWLKLGEIGQLANLSTTVLQYRQHSQSISEQQQAQQLERQQAACQQAWQRRGVTAEFQALPWRPTDRSSRHRLITMYGWWFFNAGRRWDALAYGCKAVGILPWSTAGWKLVACSLLKPMPMFDQPQA